MKHNSLLLFIVLVYLIVVVVRADIEYVVVADKDENSPSSSRSDDDVIIIRDLELVCDKNEGFVWHHLRNRLELVADDDQVSSRITKSLLHSYIANVYKKLNHDDLKQEIEELDKTKSGLIDYADYMNYAFELDVKKLEEKLAGNKKSYTNQVDYENDKRIHLLYLIEHAKWSYFNTAAQRSPLNYEQFYMFKYSFVFKDFHDYEARKIFEIFDTNQNGYLDKKELEYLIEDYDETAAKSAKNQLTIKENNKMNMNKLSLDEFKDWYFEHIDPDLDQRVENELTSILKCCDDDKDEQLSRGEVVRHCRQLINSRLTNYGLDLNRNDLDSVLNDPKDLKDEL